MKIAIDASRNRSGGARAYLIGILSELTPLKYQIEEIHVWAFHDLLKKLPNYPWIIKHNPNPLEGSLINQLLWQAFSLSSEIRRAKCDILFTTDASSFCTFNPMVALSQDMLSYEPGIMDYFGFGLSRIRLLVILFLQNYSFRRASGVIFLTKYAGKVIQQSCGLLSNVAYIPHGVDVAFKKIELSRGWSEFSKQTIDCLYVSNTEMYKHQWVVVEAIAILRGKGYDIALSLIGGGKGYAQRKLKKTIALVDPQGDFIREFDFLPHEDLPHKLGLSNLFVFASSCENMPVTLVEGMAAGLPIACSNRGPMPEVLQDGGVFFNPEDVNSVVEAIESLVKNPGLCKLLSSRAKNLSLQYSWSRCADETFKFISDTYSKQRP